MTSIQAVRSVAILCIVTILSPLAVKVAHAQKPLMEADGTWTYRFDGKLDGKVDGEVKEFELGLAVRNDKISGRTAGFDDRWSGEVAGKDKGIISLRQDRKDGYIAFFAGRLTEAGRIQGTWYDTLGNSGDFELMRKKK